VISQCIDRKSRVIQIIFNNESPEFVSPERQEAGMVPFGVAFKNLNFARITEATGAKGLP